jgi:hypothetical protein
MVLTNDELIAALQKEVGILIHLAEKLDDRSCHYRPTAKQRSSLELLRYLTVMGPTLVQSAKAGGFDLAAWQAKAAHAETLDISGVIAELEKQKDEYVRLLRDMSDEEFRKPLEMFGNTSSKGAFIVNLVLGGCAAYRTQLFLYLKSCGREELGTLNLWPGVDAPAPAPTPAS